MTKKSEVVSLMIALAAEGFDAGTAVNHLLAGEEKEVAERIAGVGFPADGLTNEALSERALAFLDLVERTELGDKKRPAVLEAITARGISILEPDAPQTRPAQPPEGGAAPPPDGGAPAQPPRTQPEPEPEGRTELADEKGLVALIVLREDGLPGAGGKFIAAGKRGKFPAEEAYAHLTAGNARLPTAED